MSQPRLSVVMPVYNGRRFIADAVSSVLNQSYRDFEFIVVDDGSTDGTSEWLASVRDDRIQVIRTTHAGLIPALNLGMERASAPLVARMDADDVSEPDRFRRQIDYLAQHPKTAVLGVAAMVIDQDGVVRDDHPPFDGSNMRLELAAGNPVVHGSVMMRRSELPNPVYEKAPEDYLLWWRLVQRERRFACLPDRLYRFRKHSASYSIEASKSQSHAVVDLLQEILQQCPTDHPRSREQRLVGWGMAAGYALQSGRESEARRAMLEFEELARGDWSPAIEVAVDRGIGFMVWGGCGSATALRLRAMQWRRRPLRWKSVRGLMSAAPFAPLIRRAVGRTSRQ